MVFVIMRLRISHTHSSGSNWCFQFLASILDGLLEFLVFRVNEINSSQFSCVLQMELLIRTIVLLTFSPRVLAKDDLAWMSAVFSSISPRTTKILLVVLEEKRETCPRIRQISWPIHIPIIIDASFLLDIQVRFCSSRDVNVFQWNGEWFFSRRVKFDSGFNVMAVYEVSWHGPEIIFRFTGIRKWVVRWWKRPFWFSKKVNVTFSLNWSMRYQGGCSQVLISSRKFLIRPSAIGKINSPVSLGNVTSFALNLLE